MNSVSWNPNGACIKLEFLSVERNVVVNFFPPSMWIFLTAEVLKIDLDCLKIAF